MKQKLKLLLIFLVVGIFSLLIYGISVKVARKNAMERSIQVLPGFSFTTLDGKIYNSLDIKSGPVLIAYYHPECEHCQYEIEEILNIQGQLADTRILLISPAQRDSIIAFFRNRSDQIGKNVILLIDDSLKFNNYFFTNVIPSTFIYDKDLNLIRFLEGEVKPEVIINSFKEHD